MLKLRGARFLVFFLVCFLIAVSMFAGTNRWTKKGPGGGTVTFSFDPVNSAIAYASGTNGVYRSVDGGRNWKLAAETRGKAFYETGVAASDPQKVYAPSVYGLYKSTDRGVTWFQVHPYASYGIAVSRTDADVVYSLSGVSSIARSADGGKTFGVAGTGIPAGTYILRVIVDPVSQDTVYALGFSAGVFKSVDGGAHWTASSAGMTSTQNYELAINPANPNTIYVASSTALYRSTDAGSTWQTVTTGMFEPFQSVTFSGTMPTTVFVGTQQGITKSADGGITWTALAAPFSVVTDLAVDPLNSSNILAMSVFRVVRSSDGGATLAESGNGLTAQTISMIVVDPRNESVVYSAGPSGLYRSADRGETWTTLTTFALMAAVDPFNSQTLYGNFSGALRRSLDSGATWQDFRMGLAGTVEVLAFIALDPQVPGTMYIIGNGSPYKSTAGGNWLLRAVGLPSSFTAYFITIDPRVSATIYAGGAGGLFKSVTGGDSWMDITAASGLTAQPSGLTVDPFDSTHLFARSQLELRQSFDGGTTWAPVDRDPDAGSGYVVLDPSTRGRQYMITYESIMRSDDGGHTWYPVMTGMGTENHEVFTVAPGGGTLYAGGRFGGVWAYRYGKTRGVAH